MLSTFEIIVVVSVSGLITAAVAFFFYQQRKAQRQEDEKIEGSKQLQLQSYERLLLLADRIALHNVISRVVRSGLMAKDLQIIITRTIKEEFDYNITQQIYVSADAWNAIKNLKDQNILIVNQLSDTLPQTASGIDLSRLLLEFSMTDTKGRLHEVVSEIVRHEARKLL